MRKEIISEAPAPARKELPLSRKLEFLGRALRLRVRETTIGFRHPFNLDAWVRESLKIEMEKRELLDKAKNEKVLIELGTKVI